MRIMILAAASLTLAACGNNDQRDNTQNVDENLSAENIVSNDVTAIDAVTGDAANMAADVDVNYTNEMAASDNASGSAPRLPKPGAKSATPPPKPETDTAANAATNSQ
jgi:hypothetical protein